MKFFIEKWKIKDLVTKFKEKKINLNPPYQRNEIWTQSAQKLLIDSIKTGYPLPTFSLHKKSDDTFEMVDGQQRTRAILAYVSGKITDNEKKHFNHEERFYNYELAITVLGDIDDDIYVMSAYSGESYHLFRCKPST